MIGENGEVQLRVPKDIALKLERKAKRKGISGRAPWAIYARMILKEAIGEEAGE